jgi:hypothetical protein
MHLFRLRFPLRAEIEGGFLFMTHGDHRLAHHRTGEAALRWHETGLPTYSQKNLGKLLQSLSGHVQLSGQPGYNDDRMVFMHSYQHYPQIIIHCVCETDVIAALKFVRKSGLQVVIRSGGHNTAGYSVNDQVVIDTGGMDHVRVDAQTPRVFCGPGVPFRTLNRMLDHYRLHLPGGGCETVNVAGYMMGGGYGFTSRLFGINCDLVHAVRLVLADGQILRASADENPDIFWAAQNGPSGAADVPAGCRPPRQADPVPVPARALRRLRTPGARRPWPAAGTDRGSRKGRRNLDP